MKPIQVKPPDPTVALIEETARQVTAATMAELEKQQAVMVEKIAMMADKIAELADLMKTSFVRKEEFTALKEQVTKNSDTITWTWRSLLGAVIAGCVALVLKR